MHWNFIKILLCFLIVQVSLAQVKTVTQTGVKRTMIRGDATTLTWTVSGDYTSDSLLFIAQSEGDPVLRLPDGAGLSSSYSSPNTTITATINADATDDWVAQGYLYDITDVTDSVTLIMGLLTVNADNSNINDTVLVPIPYYTIPIDTPNYANTFIVGQDSTNIYYRKSVAQTRTILGVDTLTSASALPDSIIYTSEISGLVTKTALADSNFVLTSETPIWDKDSTDDVTIAGTQTVTGQKTFSNNKTVFGTTTSDSVGIRGKLNVDGTVTFDNHVDFAKRFRVGDYTVNTNPYISYYPTSVSNPHFMLYNTSMLLTPPINSITPDNKNIFTAADYEPAAMYPNSIYSFGGFFTDGRIEMNNIFLNSDTSILKTIEGYGDTLRINASTILINGDTYVIGGSVANADSLGGVPAANYVTKTGIDTWSTNLYSGSQNVMRLGKDYADRRFNNGLYSDFWIIDYVVPPYNLSADWLYPIEHRTDYYNDTLNTVAHSDILNVDGTGTPIWKTNDVKIMGNELRMNVGDLPDSTALVWANTGLFGNNVILGEANKTAGETRFPMPVYGYNFQLSTGSDYTYPYLYSFYSNLVDGNTGEIERGYHFYGEGDFPSYFGGDIQMPVGDFITGTDTLTQVELGYFDDVTSSVQTQLTSKANSSEIFDTLAMSMGILDTVTTGDYPGIKIPNNITITEVSAYTNTGTATFNLEERAETTPNTAGTDVMTSDLAADTDQQETGTFSNATLDRNDWLVLNVTSITGDPTICSITIRYIKTN